MLHFRVEKLGELWLLVTALKQTTICEFRIEIPFEDSDLLAGCSLTAKLRNATQRGLAFEHLLRTAITGRGLRTELGLHHQILPELLMNLNWTFTR